MGTENSQEIVNSQEKTAAELSIQDQRVKKICERIFWGNFVVLFCVAGVAIAFDTMIKDYFGIFLIIDIIILPVLFIGYWKLIKKQPVPDWFVAENDSNWNNNFKLSESYESLRCRGRR